MSKQAAHRIIATTMGALLIAVIISQGWINNFENAIRSKVGG